MTERVLGRIVRLQVHRDPLKTREGYHPGPLLAVEEASIGPGGISGRHADGWVLDVHHAAYPRRKGGDRRALSIGFTSHYEQMGKRFGSVPLGCAGENLIVESSHPVGERDLSGFVVVRTADGDLSMRDARVATPCAEFTSFVRGLDGVLSRSELAPDLAFLDGGMRGFILSVDHLQSPLVVRLGDEVVVRPLAGSSQLSDG